MEKSRYYEDDFKEYLGELLKREYIRDSEAGITKQVIDKGYDSLSERQKIVFDAMISKFSVEQCKICGEDISWSEMLDALENGGYCSKCHKTFNEE